MSDTHAANRREDLRLITGRGRYVADSNLPGQLRAGWIRDIQVSDHPVPSKINVLGAKGAGESGCTASLPSLVSAVLDAVRPLGIQHLDMPLTPSKVWHAIQTAQAN